MTRIPLDRRVWPGFWILLALFIASLFYARHQGLSTLLLLAWVGHTLFFRNPVRSVKNPAAILSPADGQVVDISTVDETEYLKCPAIRVSIFLSVFDVHVTRSPIHGTVEHIQYRRGKFMNAMKAASGTHNESNTIGIKAVGGDGHGVVVRQIAGAIARRIKCDVATGREVLQGEAMGIICYGSRVELYIPEALFRLEIAVGSRVKAGETILGAWSAHHG